MAEPFQIKIVVPNRFRRRTFHEPNSMYMVRLMKSPASEPRTNKQIRDCAIITRRGGTM